MTIQDYARILREQWLIVVSAIVVAIVAAFAVAVLTPPRYTATIALYVAAQGSQTTDAYQGAQLSQERVTSYVELVSSPRVARDVAAALKLDVSPEDLARRITASSSLDTVVIDVRATDRDPATAAAIANAVGVSFANLVGELERPSSPDGLPSVAVRVVDPAQVPSASSTTGLPATLVLGLLAGLVIGVGGALARNLLDTSVKKPEQLAELVGAPVLGTIGFDAAIPMRPLTVFENPYSQQAEAFRQLRTNLAFISVVEHHRVVLITSSMPGEGKTTTVANLAVTLASAGTKVLVIEADLRRPQAADVLHLERAIGLTSVLTSRVRLSQAIQSMPAHYGPVDVLASGPLPPNPSELLSSPQMAALMTEVRGRYEIVLVDSPALLPVTDAAALARLTDGAIMVCRSNRTSRDQMARAVAALDAVAAPILGSVLSMVPATWGAVYGEAASALLARLNTKVQPFGSARPSASDRSSGSVEPPSSGASAEPPTSGPSARPSPSVRPSPSARPKPSIEQKPTDERVAPKSGGSKKTVEHERAATPPLPAPSVEADSANSTSRS